MIDQKYSVVSLIFLILSSYLYIRKRLLIFLLAIVSLAIPLGIDFFDLENYFKYFVYSAPFLVIAGALSIHIDKNFDKDKRVYEVFDKHDLVAILVAFSIAAVIRNQ